MEMHNPAGNISLDSKKRKKKHKANDVSNRKNGHQMIDHLETSNGFGDSEVVNQYSEKNILGTVSTGQPLAEHLKNACTITEKITVGNLNKRGKMKKTKKKKSSFRREAQHLDQKDDIPILPSIDRNLGKEISMPSENNDMQSMNQNMITIKSNGNHAEDSVRSKRKGKKHSKSRFKSKSEVQVFDQENSLTDLQLSCKNLEKKIDDSLWENEDSRRMNQNKTGMESGNDVIEGKVNERRKRTTMIKRKGGVQITFLENSMSNSQVSDKNLREGIDYKLYENAQVQSMNRKRRDKESLNNLSECRENDGRKRRKKTKSFPTNKDEVHAINRECSISNLRLSDKNLGVNTDFRLVGNVNVQSMNQDKMDMESENNVGERNANGKREKRKKKRIKTTYKHKVQVIDLGETKSKSQLSTEILKEDIESTFAKNEVAYSIHQHEMDIKHTDNLSENIANGKVKRKKKVKSKTRNEEESDKNLGEEVDDKFDKIDKTPSMNQCMKDVEPTINLAEKIVFGKSKRRKKNKSKVTNGVQTIDQVNSMSKFQRWNRNTNEEDVNDKLKRKKTKSERKTVDVAQNVDQASHMPIVQSSDDKSIGDKIDGKLVESEDVHINCHKRDVDESKKFAECNMNDMKKRKKGKVKSYGQSPSTELTDFMPDSQLSDKKPKRKVVDLIDDIEDVQILNYSEMGAESVYDSAAANVAINTKRKNAKKKAINDNADRQTYHENAMENSQLTDENIRQKIDGKFTEIECTSVESKYSMREGSKYAHRDRKMHIIPNCSKLVRDMDNPSDLCKEGEDVLKIVADVSSDIASSDELERKSGPSAIVTNMEREVFPSCGKYKAHSNQMAKEDTKFENRLHEVNESIVMEGKSSYCSSNVEEPRCLPKYLGENISIGPTAGRKKLLVLDVNGLLADIVMPPPKDHRGDIHILGRAIFKRPFCHDFLKFCFQNFDIGIWSSRAKKTIDRIVDYLLGNLKQKLLFCWDMSQSTQTGFKTLENIHKPLVCKELSKIWENEDPEFPWKKGDYDESNTLLLDDSPYKALLNPPHTAIFPHSYQYEDTNDNSLGRGGDLRIYLEGFLNSKNTKEYIEQHPFGQSAINETNMSWQFYSRVLQTISKELPTKSPSQLQAVSELEETAVKL